MQTTGALSVEALGGGCDGEAGGEGCCAELGCTATGCEDGSDGDVFDEVGIDARTLDEGFEGAGQEISGGCVFESAFAAFGDGCSEGACYNDLGIC